jgi:hypothetical protein
MKKSELELIIRHEVRNIFRKNFNEFKNDMNNSYDTLVEKHLPKIVDEVFKMYPKIDE